MLDRHHADVVGFARIAVGVEAELRHEEQRQPLGTRRRIGRASEDEVDDIIGHVVVAERDVDLRADDVERAVTTRRGAAAQRADVGTRLRLGQVHRAGPFAGRQFRQVQRLLLRASVVHQRLDRADRQRRRQREAHVGGTQRLEHRGGQHERHPLPAERFGRSDRAPATGDIGLVCRNEALWHRDAILAPVRADGIADAVERCPFACGKFPRPLQHGVEDVALDAQIGDLGDMVEHEPLFGNRWGEGHGRCVLSLELVRLRL